MTLDSQCYRMVSAFWKQAHVALGALSAHSREWEWKFPCAPLFSLHILWYSSYHTSSLPPANRHSPAWLRKPCFGPRACGIQGRMHPAAQDSVPMPEHHVYQQPWAPGCSVYWAFSKMDSAFSTLHSFSAGLEIQEVPPLKCKSANLQNSTILCECPLELFHEAECGGNQLPCPVLFCHYLQVIISSLGSQMERRVYPRPEPGLSRKRGLDC